MLTSCDAKRFDPDTAIGRGTHGEVFSLGNKECMKLMPLEYSCTWKELIFMKLFQQKHAHPNLLTMTRVVFDASDTRIGVVMKQGIGDLHRVRKDSCPNFNQEQVTEIMSQLVQGLAHMHRNQYWHRDVKPANVILFSLDLKRGDVKLADYSLTTHHCGNPTIKNMTSGLASGWYRAPECWKEIANACHSSSHVKQCPHPLCSGKCGCHYTEKMDVYSLGMLFAELLLKYPFSQYFCQQSALNPGYRPWRDVDFYKLSAETKQGPGDLASGTLKFTPAFCAHMISLPRKLDALDLLRCMIHPDPKKRWNIFQVAAHGFFKDVKVLPHSKIPVETKSFEDDVVPVWGTGRFLAFFRISARETFDFYQSIWKDTMRHQHMLEPRTFCIALRLMEEYLLYLDRTKYFADDDFTRIYLLQQKKKREEEATTDYPLVCYEFCFYIAWHVAAALSESHYAPSLRDILDRFLSDVRKQRKIEEQLCSPSVSTTSAAESTGEQTGDPTTVRSRRVPLNLRTKDYQVLFMKLVIQMVKFLSENTAVDFLRSNWFSFLETTEVWRRVKKGPQGPDLLISLGNTVFGNHKDAYSMTLSNFVLTHMTRVLGS